MKLPIPPIFAQPSARSATRIKLPAPLRLVEFIVAATLLLVFASPAFAQSTGAAQQSPRTLPDSQSQTIPVQPRITQPLDETKLTLLRGNIHPLARPEFDHGPADDAVALTRMLLLLKRSPVQEAALQLLLAEQQDKSSPNFHKWLAPEEFGQRFGPADADIQAVTQWLVSRGFSDIKVSLGRTAIEFSGNVAQVRSAFHTQLHRYVVSGVEKIANANDPQIPTAVAPVVGGIVSLHSFRPTSHVVPVGTFLRLKSTGQVMPLFTPPGSSSFFPLAPADFATIYNTAPLINGSPRIDGTGQTIAIIGESDIRLQDVVDFRNLFGLPQNFSSANVIVNGTDPGFNTSETESDLDLQWAGAVAPGATIDFVTSAPTETTSGVHLSAIYAVDNNLAAIMSVSFGQCEQHLGATGNQFYNALWQQAAAQGITVFVSSGDGGSAGCDDFNTQSVATQGLAVSGLASTPFNVSVGGTDFDQFNNWFRYWNTTNAPVTQASVKGYIPEIPWNDSCAQIGITGCGASAPYGSVNIVAGSGGPSSIYSKPSWQSGTGVPNDGRRDSPDISLFASNGFTGSLYIICQADVVTPPNPTCGLSNFGFTYQGVGGTSASAPALAGIMALVNQKQATTANPAPRQGNANYVFYALAQKPGASCASSTSEAATCIFNDITKGNSMLPTGAPGLGTISVPCQGGSPNCSVSVAGNRGVLVDPNQPSAEAWMATAGYDMGTGLGSVNAQNLVNNWSSVSFLPSATTLTASVNGKAVTSIGGITHGTPIGVSSTVVAGSGASGTPTGQVALVANPNPTPGNRSGALGIEALSLMNGTATSSSVILPGGTYNLSAHFQGDGTFGPSDSSPAIPVSITAEGSKTLISIPVFDPTTGRETGNTPTSLVYATPYIARIDVGNASASLTFPPQPTCTPPACPTGTITLTDSYNGGAPAPLDGGVFSLNSSGFAEDFAIQLPGGTHQLSASYSGDNSFNASSNSYRLTVTPAPTTTGPGNPPLPAQISTPFGLGATIRSQNFGGAMESCNVTFLDGNTPVPGTVTCSGQNGGATYGAFIQPYLIVNQTAAGAHTYTAQFNGDANYAPSVSAAMTTRVFYGTTTTLSADSTAVQYGTNITLTAVVDSIVSKGPAITPLVSFTFNNTSLSGTVTYTPFTDSSGNSALRASITTQPDRSGFYWVSFGGDSTYSQSGDGIYVRVNIPDFNVSATQGSVTATAGQPVTLTISVTPLTNAASPVTLSCPQGYFPLNVTCSFAPPTVNLSNGNVSTSVLTLNSLAPSPTNTTSSVPVDLPPPTPYFPTRPPWPLAFLAVLVGVLLFALSRGPRRARFGAVAALALTFSLFVSFLGCGGGSGGGGTGGGGPVPSSITLTADNVKVAYPGNINLTARVTSAQTPGGTVAFLIDGPSGPSNFALVNGVASYQVPVPQVGTHVIRAQYLGDANTLPSQTSGALNIVVTGNSSVGIAGTTGDLTHFTFIQFQLQ